MTHKHIKRLQRKLIAYEYGIVTTYLFFCFRFNPLTRNALSFNHNLLVTLSFIIKNFIKILISSIVIIILYLFHDRLINYLEDIKNYWLQYWY